MCLWTCVACLAWKLWEKERELLKSLLSFVDYCVFVGWHSHTEKEKLPTPLLLTLRSVYREGQVSAAVRELEVGCIHSSQPHNKKVHFILYLPDLKTLWQIVNVNYVGNLNILHYCLSSCLFFLLFSHLFCTFSFCLPSCRMESFYGRM